MIHPLRTTHCSMFLALALFLPVLFVSGLFSRHKWPTKPTPDSIQLRADEVAVSEQTANLNGRKFAVRIFADRSNQDELEIQLSPTLSLVIPDVLVYWSETESTPELSANARLLGPFSPTDHYRLPAEARGRGFIVLYSLAQKQVLGSFSMGGRP